MASVALNDLACLPQVEAATNLIYAQVRDKLLYYNNKRNAHGTYAATGIITDLMIEKRCFFFLCKDGIDEYGSKKHHHKVDRRKSEKMAGMVNGGSDGLEGAAVAGSNVSLRCSVFGLPSAVVSWWSVDDQVEDQLDPVQVQTRSGH